MKECDSIIPIWDCSFGIFVKQYPFSMTFPYLYSNMYLETHDPYQFMHLNVELLIRINVIVCSFISPPFSELLHGTIYDIIIITCTITCTLGLLLISAQLHGLWIHNP